MIARRVLEHAAAVRLRERLRPAPPRASLVHPGPDPAGRPRARSATVRRDHDASSGQARPPVLEAGLDRPSIARPRRRAAGTDRRAPRRRPARRRAPRRSSSPRRRASPGSRRRTPGPTARARARRRPARAAASHPRRSAARRPGPTTGTRGRAAARDPGTPRPRRGRSSPCRGPRTGCPRPRTASDAATRSASDSGSRNRAAGPPIRNVVSGASGEPGPNPVAAGGPQDRLALDRDRQQPSGRAGSRRPPDPFERGVAEHPDVAAPHRDDQVALANLAVEEPDDVSSVRQVHDPARPMPPWRCPRRRACRSRRGSGPARRRRHRSRRSRPPR